MGVEVDWVFFYFLILFFLLQCLIFFAVGAWWPERGTRSNVHGGVWSCDHNPVVRLVEFDEFMCDVLRTT